ncbi:MAG: hypothetical protein HGB19_04365 [Chlorobiales bacterium]|nr:hypothetical protein [Chlorobiales bacterium]
MNKLILFLVVGILFTASVCNAQDQESAAARSLRVAVMKRVLVFEKKLGVQKIVRLAVLYNDNDQVKNMQVIAEEFRDPGINVSPVSVLTFKNEAKKYDAVYVDASIDARDPHKVSMSQGLLSLTNSRKAVQSGLATVGVVLEDGKPVIIINKRSAQEEKREFLAEILALSTIIE